MFLQYSVSFFSKILSLLDSPSYIIFKIISYNIYKSMKYNKLGKTNIEEEKKGIFLISGKNFFKLKLLKLI